MFVGSESTLTDGDVQGYMDLLASNQALYMANRDQLGKDFSNENPYSQIYTTYLLIGFPQTNAQDQVINNNEKTQRNLEFGMYAY